MKSLQHGYRIRALSSLFQNPIVILTTSWILSQDDQGAQMKVFWAKRRTGEIGQALTVTALMFPVLLGFVGLGVDFGRLAAQQRKLQNYADAAALAGAQDLSLYESSACTDAATSLSGNNNPATPVCQTSASDASSGVKDTITVTLTQSLP